MARQDFREMKTGKSMCRATLRSNYILSRETEIFAAEQETKSR